MKNIHKSDIHYTYDSEGDYEIENNCIEYRNKMDQLHRDDGPAKILIVDKSRNYLITERYSFGKKHCMSGPAVVKYIPRVIEQPIIYFDQLFEFWFHDEQIKTSLMKEWLMDNQFKLNPFKWDESTQFYFALQWASYNSTTGDFEA